MQKRFNLLIPYLNNEMKFHDEKKKKKKKLFN